MLPHAVLLGFLYFACLQIYRLFFSFLPVGHPRSELVGYPVFHDFPIDRLFQFHYGELLLVPLAAWGMYLSLRRLFRLGPLAPARPLPSEFPLWAEKFGSLMRSLVIGFLFGRLFLSEGVSLLQGGAISALLFTLGGLVLSFVHPAAQSLFHLAAVPFLFLGLARLPPLTVFVLDGKVLPLEWLGWKVAFSLALGCFILVLSLLWKSSSKEEWKRVSGSVLVHREKMLFFTLVLPLLFFIPFRTGQASIAEDLFHTGESIVPASLLARGWVPWKDFLFVHGLLEDCLIYFGGMETWGTIWGAHFVYLLWLLPLAMASSALLSQKLFRSNPAFLITVLILTLAPVKALGDPFHPRFFLEAPCLFACLLFLEKPSIWRAALLSFLTVFTLFLTAETLFLAIGFTLAVAVYSFQNKNWRPSALFCGFCTLWLLIGFIILAYHGALLPFIQFHLSTANGHRYTGGIPLGPLAKTAYLFNLLSISAVLWFFCSSLSSQRKFSASELTMGALAVFAIFYYQKYLSRADHSHFFVFWSPCRFLFFFILDRVLQKADTFFSGRLRPASALLCVFIFLFQAPKLKGVFNQIEGRSELTTNSFDPRLGPVDIQEDIESKAIALRDFFETRSFRGPVQDLTNQPLLFHHVLDFLPATRFPYLSLAIHPKLQNQFVREIQEKKPRFIVFMGTGNNALVEGWDGIPNAIRHPLIFRYLLAQYQPIAWVSGHLIAEDRSRALTALSPQQAFGPVVPSDWGYVLENAAEDFMSVSDIQVLPTKTTSEGYETTVSIPASFNKSDSLDLFFSQISDDLFTVETPAGKILWKSRKGTNRKYRIPLGASPQWYAQEGSLLRVAHTQPLILVSARWVPELEQDPKGPPRE